MITITECSKCCCVANKCVYDYNKLKYDMKYHFATSNAFCSVKYLKVADIGSLAQSS